MKTIPPSNTFPLILCDSLPFVGENLEEKGGGKIPFELNIMLDRPQCFLSEEGRCDHVVG